MATTATKLPAAAPAAKPAAPSAAPRSDTDPAVASGLGFFKVMVWLLVLIDLGGGGFFAWLHFRNRDLSAVVSSAAHRVVTEKADLVNLEAVVRKIQQENINVVEEPVTLVSGVAKTLGITEFVQITKASGQNFGKTNYYETTVPIVFLFRAGYRFSDCLSFLKQVENANPTVQIKEVDFGKRQNAIGLDEWHPVRATVRIMTLRTSQ